MVYFKKSLGQKIVIFVKNNYKKILLFLLPFLLVSCVSDNKTEQKYVWKSATIGNYKYITAYFNQALLIIDLEINNHSENELIIANNYGDFIIVHDLDTIKLGQKMVSNKYYIDEGERSVIQLPTTVPRDDKKYEDFLIIVENGDLFMRSKMNKTSYFLIEKHQSFFIDEGGKEGDVKW